MLLAEVLELRDAVLVLAEPPVPQPFDDVHLLCAECATELAGIEWSEERLQRLPHGQRPLPDSEALDALAARLNEAGECNGGDLVELVSTLLSRTGRRVEDEPDDEGVWS
jgi:hypothetical protein